MDGLLAIAVPIIATLVGIALAARTLWGRRAHPGRRRAGPEYGYVSTEGNEVHAAGPAPAGPANSQEILRLRELDPRVQARFFETWSWIQARSLQNPSDAVREADRLVSETMQARGCPLSLFEQTAGSPSFLPPRAAEQYRLAQEIAGRARQNGTTMEELRQAMACYRTLFEELVGKQLRDPRPARKERLA